MGKELNSKEALADSKPQRRDSQGRFQRHEEPKLETFKEYVQLAIIKRSSAERRSFNREDYVSRKLQETNNELRRCQGTLEALGRNDPVDRTRVEEYGRRMRRLVAVLRRYCKEMADIKEELREFYKEARDEYIFG